MFSSWSGVFGVSYQLLAVVLVATGLDMYVYEGSYYETQKITIEEYPYSHPAALIAKPPERRQVI